MPTYRIPVRGRIEVEADDPRLALACADAVEDLEDICLVDLHIDGEPVEVEP